MKSTSARNRRSCMKPHALFGVNHNRVFCADVLFIRTENTVGARSAQVRSSHAAIFETPYMAASELFHQDLGAPLPVVERFFRLGQRSDGGLGEAALDEPMRGTRGEHEQLPEAELARFDFAVLEQLLAITPALVFGPHRQRRQFRRLACQGA